jgi:hypothetical protein
MWMISDLYGGLDGNSLVIYQILGIRRKKFVRGFLKKTEKGRC